MSDTMSVHRIKPLVTINGHRLRDLLGGYRGPTTYDATCRDCGLLPAVANPQSLQQAALIQNRHLAEHLAALAVEMAEAAR